LHLAGNVWRENVFEIEHFSGSGKEEEEEEEKVGLDFSLAMSKYFSKLLALLPKPNFAIHTGNVNDMRNWT
jgi:hypothetical protein